MKGEAIMAVVEAPKRAAKKATGKAATKKANKATEVAATNGGKRNRRPTPVLDEALTGGINIIDPDTDDFDRSLGRRNGRKDNVSPVLDPVLEDFVDQGKTEFQLRDRDPFTVYQVRGWASRLVRDDRLPEGVEAIKVSGGSQNAEAEPRNIHVRIVYYED